MIDLYTAATPNGRKVSIALEELGLAYTVRPVDLQAGDQRAPGFLARNPNGRIPVIVDHDDNGWVVFESGAILVYLAERCGRLMPADARGRSGVMQWLMWQMSALGPMQGQANVFQRYFPQRLPAVIARYEAEVARLYAVMETHLARHEYLAGDYSVADIACWPWLRLLDWTAPAQADKPQLQRWFMQISQRPAVQRGIAVAMAPTPLTPPTPPTPPTAS